VPPPARRQEGRRINYNNDNDSDKW